MYQGQNPSESEKKTGLLQMRAKEQITDQMLKSPHEPAVAQEKQLQQLFIHQHRSSVLYWKLRLWEAFVEQIATKHQKTRKLVRMTQLSMKEQGFRYLFPFVDRPINPLLMKLFHQWTRYVVMWDWGGSILMLQKFELHCRLCSLLSVCVQYCVAMVLMSGVLGACHQLFIPSMIKYQ
jgi:hypothetical protein